MRLTVSYDDDRRIGGTEYTLHPAGSPAVLDTRTYAWDEVGNRTGTTFNGRTVAFGYDSVARMRSSDVSGQTTYQYDGVGNRMSVTGGPNPGNYVAEWAGHQYSSTPFDRREYDANGNLTYIRTPDGQLKARLVYDYRNLLIEYTDYVAEQRHTYAYDCLGRRIRKVVDADGAALTTRYLYDGGWQVVEERGPAGTVTYVHGAGLDEVVSMRRGGGSGSPPSGDYYLLADEQGSVVALTDASGTVLERYEYDDFGRPRFLNASGAECLDSNGVPCTQSAYGNTRLFTGREYDAETGLYYYRTRYLDPAAGRFLTRDTIGIWGDANNLGNPYAYVGNNPWTGVDPYGLEQPGYEDVDRLLRRGKASMAGTAKGNASAAVDPNSAAARRGVAETDRVAHQTLKDFGRGVGEGANTIMNMADSVTLIGGVVHMGERAAAKQLLKEAAEEASEKGLEKPGLWRRAWNWISGGGKTACNGADDATKAGRSGKQARLRELADDPNVSSADRGWIKQDINAIERGQRTNIRVPPGKNLAHQRGFEAKKGYSYEHSNLQEIDLHKLQHKHEGY